jgi:hypothetical protein
LAINPQYGDSDFYIRLLYCGFTGQDYIDD